TIAPNLDNSAYRFRDWKGEEQITITPEMISQQTPLTKDIYLTVGYSTSTFSILTYFANSSDLTLQDGYSRVGELKLNEYISYKYLFHYNYFLIT
ncbi:MAG: hypothetical protein QF535_13240, partial [Anaerolineales bacterium]|nr:hypothetical protein [Anaerolineales bacterium]